MNKQGSYANSSGNTLESTVRSVLESKGFKCFKYSEYSNYKRNHTPEQIRDRYGTELLLKNVPFTTIYGHPGKTEFLLRSAKYDLEIRIECKWQEASGSVDEKFPYVYLNAIEAMPEKDIIIIADGGGAKPGSIQWLKTVAANKMYIPESKQDKNIKVMSLSEFIRWTNQTFR